MLEYRRSLLECCPGRGPVEIDPNFLIPLRTPEKKSGLSVGKVSEAAESTDEDSLDSSEPEGRRVSLSAMICHGGQNGLLKLN